LIDKYGSTATLLTGLAVSKMHQGAFEEAETSLQEALTKVSSLLTDRMAIDRPDHIFFPL
jgi:hypothetical protein